MEYGNTKTPSMRRRLGSATLSQLAFSGEGNPNFSLEKSHWDNAQRETLYNWNILYTFYIRSNLHRWLGVLCLAPSELNISFNLRRGICVEGPTITDKHSTALRTIPSRQLRSSSDSRLLRTPSFRLKSFGQGKFSYQASVLWNSLPISLRHSNSTLAFKSALKTHLFPSQ